MTVFKAIVAVCEDWGIGLDGSMVVENRADMRHFVRCTTGHSVIMGRRTLESFPDGRPLVKRRNIVLTRDKTFSREGVETLHSVEEVRAAVAGEDVAWIIGGESVYRQFLPFCAEVVLTLNRCIRPVDTWFPNLDDDASWELASESAPAQIQSGEGDAGILFSFRHYQRRA